jgi:hypothetical protein
MLHSLRAFKEDETEFRTVVASESYCYIMAHLDRLGFIDYVSEPIGVIRRVSV